MQNGGRDADPSGFVASRQMIHGAAYVASPVNLGMAALFGSAGEDWSGDGSYGVGYVPNSVVDGRGYLREGGNRTWHLLRQRFQSLRIVPSTMWAEHSPVDFREYMNKEYARALSLGKGAAYELGGYLFDAGFLAADLFLDPVGEFLPDKFLIAMAAKKGLVRVDDVARIASDVDANKLRHIFGQERNKLDTLLDYFSGSQEAAYSAVQKATQEAVMAKQSVTVRGRVIEGTARIGSFWVP